MWRFAVSFSIAFVFASKSVTSKTVLEMTSNSTLMSSDTENLTSLGRERMTQCVKTGPCSCRTSDGVIDLSPLAGKNAPRCVECAHTRGRDWCTCVLQSNAVSRYKDVPDTQGADMYSWNPCNSFNETSDCVNVAACQKAIGLNESKNIGTQDSAQFFVTSTGDLTLHYTFPDPSGVNRTTIVTLTCDPNAHDMIAVTGEMVAFQYSITLMSKFACARKTD